jgi:hypothetical protein
LWSATTYLAVERGHLPVLTGEALAIATLLVMIVVSFWILRPVTDERRDWEKLSAM